MFDQSSCKLNQFLRACCPAPFGPAGLLSNAPGVCYRKNLPSSHGRLLSSLLAIFPLGFIACMAYPG